MSSSLIMRQKLNTGHYGPAPTVNVIPELDGNRVKLMCHLQKQKKIIKFNPIPIKLLNDVNSRGRAIMARIDFLPHN